MSGSVAEVQALADQILELIGMRTMRSGCLIIHYDGDGKVSHLKTELTFRPQAPLPPMRKGLDGRNGSSAD